MSGPGRVILALPFAWAPNASEELIEAVPDGIATTRAGEAVELEAEAELVVPWWLTPCARGPGPP